MLACGHATRTGEVSFCGHSRLTTCKKLGEAAGRGKDAAAPVTGTHPRHFAWIGAWQLGAARALLLRHGTPSQPPRARARRRSGCSSRRRRADVWQPAGRPSARNLPVRISTAPRSISLGASLVARPAAEHTRTAAGCCAAATAAATAAGTPTSRPDSWCSRTRAAPTPRTAPPGCPTHAASRAAPCL